MKAKTRVVARGFTLVEMLIVIGIIVVLVALTVTVGLRFRTSSQVNETNNLMTTLNIAMDEWTTESDRALTIGIDGDPTNRSRYDIQSDLVDTFHVAAMLDTMTRSSRVKQLVTSVDDRYLQRIDDTVTPKPLWLRLIDENDPCNAGQGAGYCLNQTKMEYAKAENQGKLIIVDAWGTPLRLVHPGRLWEDGDSEVRDDDGTIRTSRENWYGVPRNRRVVLVSAGPDQKFGDRSALFVTDAFKDSQDNIQSGELVQQ
jgi:prepilin-type N-terminal cleavage/methylation domain-containing protein